MMNIYISFCKVFVRNPLNPSLPTCLSYLEFLAQKMKSPKTVTNYWGAVKFFHALLKVPFTVSNDIEIQLFLKSVPLSKRHVSKQMSPLLKKDLSRMCRLLDLQGTKGLVLKTALTMFFFVFLEVLTSVPKMLLHSTTLIISLEVTLRS